MTIQKIWATCKNFPGGKYVFGKLIGFYIPYTGTVHPYVETFEEGVAEVRITDRRRIRNHLKCVHAIALANVGELASGMAVFSRLPKDARIILVRLSISYSKKSRGRLIARAECPPIPDNQKRDHDIAVAISDESGEVTARLNVVWQVGPTRPPR
jgi:acyl-coenzyme A thioesterase PaaI-like protein